MKDFILNIDHQLFTFLNGLHAPWLDPIMYWFSHKLFWIPFYALLLAGVIYKYRKKAILIVVLTIAMVAATDQISRGFKYGVGRYRPCRTESAHLPKPHLLDNHCGGKYGFFSSHAANTFGIAIFFGTLLIPVVRKAKWILLFWAAVVTYSRIYLGVHYPLDVTCGAICGWLIGSLFLKIYELLTPKVFTSSNITDTIDN